jgi:hypothetical protein
LCFDAPHFSNCKIWTNPIANSAGRAVSLFSVIAKDNRMIAVAIQRSFRNFQIPLRTRDYAEFASFTLLAIDKNVKKFIASY